MEVLPDRSTEGFLFNKLFMEIKGTAFEIIAQVNNLKQVKGNVFQDEKGSRYYMNKLGFTPIEIWNSESIRYELTNVIDKLKSKNNRLKTELDESDYNLCTLKNNIESIIAKIRKKCKDHFDTSISKSKRKELLYKKKNDYLNNLITKMRSSIFHGRIQLDDVKKELDSIGDSMKLINKEHTNENKSLFNTKNA